MSGVQRFKPVFFLPSLHPLNVLYSRPARTLTFNELRAACSDYIRGELQTALARWIKEIADGCQVRPDEGDVDGQTLILEYRTLYASAHLAYSDFTAKTVKSGQGPGVS